MPPAIGQAQVLWQFATSVVVSTLTSALVFATLSTRHPRIPAAHWAAVLGVYTAFSLALDLIAPPWFIDEPTLLSVIDWLAVAQGALIGTVVGASISRHQARRDSVSTTPL